jgi:hypothetical protein
MGWGGSGSVAPRLFYGCSTRPDSCLDQICGIAGRRTRYSCSSGAPGCDGTWVSSLPLSQRTTSQLKRACQLARDLCRWQSYPQSISESYIPGAGSRMLGPGPSRLRMPTGAIARCCGTTGQRIAACLRVSRTITTLLLARLAMQAMARSLGEVHRASLCHPRRHSPAAALRRLGLQCWARRAREHRRRLRSLR